MIVYGGAIIIINYLGYKKEKTTQNSGSWQASIHQEDRARVLAEIKYFISIKQGFWSAQYRFLKANFTILNIYNRGNIFYDDAGKPIRIIGSMMDISDLKKTEQDLRKRNEELHNLSTHLQQQREKEKISFAYEMHEQLGQELAGMHLELSSVIDKISTNDQMSKQLTGISKNLKNSIHKIRKISSELYPGILKDIGLPEALEWHAQKFSDKSGIHILFSCEEEEIDLPAEKAITLYRTYQQALDNAVQHGATEVMCTLRSENNQLVLSICDDGKNFMKAEEIKTSIAYHAMEERLAIINGNLTIEIDWQEGTNLIIKLPTTTT